MRRATKEREYFAKQISISIHALHEESDANGRRSVPTVAISIHALHEESDRA